VAPTQAILDIHGRPIGVLPGGGAGGADYMQQAAFAQQAGCAPARTLDTRNTKPREHNP